MKKWVILSAIIALSLILMLGGCKKEEQPEVTQPEPEPEPTPEPEPQTPPTPEPTEEVEINENVMDGPKIDYGSRGILSDVKCENGVISGIITNAFMDKEQIVAQSVDGRQQKSNVRIQVNGMNIYDYVCEKDTLKANEYTYCSDLMGRLKVKVKTGDGPNDENEVAVWFEGDTDNRGVTTVRCTEASSLTQEEAQQKEVETAQEITS